MFDYLLLYLVNDSLECFGVVDSEVSENLAVNLDTCLVKQTHKLRVTETFEACGSVDTLYPQCAEGALFVLAVAVSVGKSLLPSVLSYGPDVLARSVITFGKLQNSLALRT